jgi:hypothetical protein
LHFDLIATATQIAFTAWIGMAGARPLSVMDAVIEPRSIADPAHFIQGYLLERR